MSTTAHAGGLATDRRTFLAGLGATAAAASFAPFMTAAPAIAAPAPFATPVPAVFWGLPYMDATGRVARYAPPRRYAREERARDFDPHAELFAAG